MSVVTLTLLLPVLSGGHGLSPRGFWYSWAEEPLLVAFVFAGVAIYTRGVNRLRAASPTINFPGWRQASFYGGILAIVVALLSPVAAYSQELFFMHMVQHLLLLLIAPPLILLGAPLLPMLWALPKRSRLKVARQLQPHRPLARIGHWLTQPIVAVALFVVSVAMWHVPDFYDAAQGRTITHDLEHAMFYGTALLYWWPIIHPAGGRRRLTTGWAFPYLLPPFLEGMLIGVLLTFAPDPLYRTYAGLTEQPIWGFTTLEDQELGGLIMWVPGGMFFLIPLIGLLVRLVAEEERRASRPRSNATRQKS